MKHVWSFLIELKTLSFRITNNIPYRYKFTRINHSNGTSQGGQCDKCQYVEIKSRARTLEAMN